MIGMTLGRIAACCGGVYFGEEGIIASLEKF